MKSRFRYTVPAMLACLTLLGACSDEKPKEKTASKGVFTPYVEAHREAQQTADQANKSLQRSEERLQRQE